LRPTNASHLVAKPGAHVSAEIKRAFISRGGHNFKDEGTSFSEVDFGCALTGCHPNQMFENFTSTKGATLTADPDDFQGEQ
jgi:hypothetical protein